MKKLVKIYVAEETAAKLKERAGRESLSSFVNSLIDCYFQEYPGISKAEKKLMEVMTPKIGDTVTVKAPQRFAIDIADVHGACIHGVTKGYRCWQCGGLAQVKPHR